MIDPAAKSPYTPAPETRITHPAWAKTATIYQLNQRQFTPEGTLQAARDHLPRLRALGVDIIWLMPINPIGQERRKGGLGSPYAVRDYREINPEFGTLRDLRSFVGAAHALGMKVILDWVANHTAWDNHLVTDHPEWYARDWKGDFRPTPWWDWDDIIDLDYSHEGLRRYMTESMCYWVREADIDGFRCDVAGFVPRDFWERARAELDAIKPVFMLAEWEARDLHDAAFDMTYAWSWNEAMHHIAVGKADVGALHVFYAWNESSWPRDAIRMMFVSNHDKNAWEGTEFEQFGPMREAAIALSVIGEGMPLIYNGQEAGFDKRLAFFDKDEIVWREDPQGTLYRTLFALKKAHPALWNGAWGARMVKVPNDMETAVLSFVRAQGEDGVFGVFNFTGSHRTVTFGAGPQEGPWVDAFDGSPLRGRAGQRLDLAAWGWRVFVRPPAVS